MKLDEAIVAVQTAEATFGNAKSAKVSTETALSAAQSMDSAAGDALNSAGGAYKTALDDLVAAAQAEESGLPVPPPPPPVPPTQ